jgi:hypothetical protein
MTVISVTTGVPEEAALLRTGRGGWLSNLFIRLLPLHYGRIKQLIMHKADEQVFRVGAFPTSEKKPISLSIIDMNKTTEKTKTTAPKIIDSSHQMKGVMAAVTAVVGEEPDTYDGVDEHPSSLDLPTQKPKITKLLADCERLPKGSAERSKAFRKLLEVLHDEYAK